MALQAGADANHKNRVCVRINVQQNSYTALHAAALNGHHALAQASWAQGRTSTRKTMPVAHRCIGPGPLASARWRRCSGSTAPSEGACRGSPFWAVAHRCIGPGTGGIARWRRCSGSRRRVRGHAVGRRPGRSHTAVLGQGRGASRGGDAAPAARRRVPLCL